MTRLYAALRALLFILTVALVATVALGVFYRYALHHSLFWATEVPNFLFVCIVFFGAVVAYHEKKHIALTALLERMAPRNRALGEIAIHGMVLAFSVFLIITGAKVVGQTMGSPSEALKMPLGYLYAVLPVSSALVAIEAVVDIARLLRSRRAGETA